MQEQIEVQDVDLIEVVFTPWRKKLLEDVIRARDEVFFVCPFIKASIVKDIFQALADKALLTRTVSRFPKG